MASSALQLTLHWLDRSRAQRIIWLLEELRLSYRLVTYARLPDQQAPPSLRAIHPLGKSPVLEINNTRTNKRLVLAESANIVEYIADNFGPHLVPQKWPGGVKGEIGAERNVWRRYSFYMHYAEGSLMALIGTGALKNAIKAAPVPFFVKPLTGRIAGQIESDYLDHNYDSHFSFLETGMAEASAEAEAESTTPTADEGARDAASQDSTENAREGPFIAGPKLTAADFMMAFPLEAAQQIAGLTREKYPLLTDYVARVQRQDAYKRAIERIVKETGKYEPGI